MNRKWILENKNSFFSFVWCHVLLNGKRDIKDERLQQAFPYDPSEVPYSERRKGKVSNPKEIFFTERCSVLTREGQGPEKKLSVQVKICHKSSMGGIQLGTVGFSWEGYAEGDPLGEYGSPWGEAVFEFDPYWVKNPEV